MERRRLAAASVLTLALTALVVRGGSAQQPGRQSAALGIGAGTVALRWDVVNPDWPFAMFAFVETGSASDKCLITLQNSNDPWKIRAVFCTPYVVRGKDGVQVTVLFDQPGVTPEIIVDITLYQERARFYGTPLYWPS